MILIVLKGGTQKMPNDNDGFDTPLDNMPVGPPKTAAQPPQKMPAPVQAPAPQPIANRYSPYMMPTRVGIIDNESQKPVIEAQDLNEVILASLSDILNRLERIERSL